jgi:hypothetical protein
VPADARATVFVANFPLDATPEAVAGALAAAGLAAKRVHFEVGNSGRPTGFGYAELASPAAAAAAVAAPASSALEVGGRALRVSAYTPESNYRNADGSRRRDKKAMKKSIADREDAAADAAEAEAAEQAGASRYRGGHRGELGALDAYVAPRGARGASERGLREARDDNSSINHLSGLSLRAVLMTII